MKAHNASEKHAHVKQGNAKHDPIEREREDVNEGIVAADDTGMLANERSLTEEFERTIHR